MGSIGRIDVAKCLKMCERVGSRPQVEKTISSFETEAVR